VRLGIDMARHTALERDPGYRQWCAPLLPALDNVFKLVALDESCGRWEAHHYVRPWQPLGERDDPRTYTTVLYTPPARPEWLVQLQPPAATGDTTPTSTP
jgi:hypothetical protein